MKTTGIEALDGYLGSDRACAPSSARSEELTGRALPMAGTAPNNPDWEVLRLEGSSKSLQQWRDGRVGLCEVGCATNE